LHFIKKWLNERGFELIKKRAWKDGHMLDDKQQYVRINKKSSDSPHIHFYNGNWNLKGAEEEWNKGQVTFCLNVDIFDCQNDCYEKILSLGQKHGFEVN
jgi:glutaredoxin